MQMVRLIFTLITLSICSTSFAKEKIALVIGNADYTSSALVNSVNDAEDIASTLENLDFGVTLVKNATKDKMQTAISEFVKSLNDDTVGLFYYSGHAVQYKGSNYLIPIGSVDKTNHVKDLPKNTVNTNTVLDGLNQSQSNLNFVFLDACRDNPFKNLSKEITPGLAKTSVGARSVSTNLIMKDLSITRGVSETHEQVKDTKGILVAYSTMPGSVASDGSGRNSPYTKSLLKHITKTNSLAQIMLSDVQQDVQQSTNSQQTPIFESAITGRFCFNETNNGCGKAVVNIHSSYLKGVKGIQKLTLADGSSYEGQVVDGKPHGKGITMLENGDRYEGEMKNGFADGSGHYYGADGHDAKGQWENDLHHGFNIVRNKDGRYEGNFINGEPGGIGIYKWANGDRFEGEWKDGLPYKGLMDFSHVKYNGELDKDRNPHGKGVIYLKDGGTFESEFNYGNVSNYIKTKSGNTLMNINIKNATMDQISKFTKSVYLDLSVFGILDVTVILPKYTYSGTMFNNKLTGFGNFVAYNGTSYKGGFLNNKHHGKGVYVNSIGNRYAGIYNKNKREGYGIQDYEDGMRILGFWKDDLPHGKGLVYLSDGSSYRGMFKNGKKHGNGIFLYEDGSIYDGDWKNNKWHGSGTYTHITEKNQKSEYRGGFKNGKFNGIGALTSKSGVVYKGKWKDGIENGLGIQIMTNGDRYEGMWVNGIKHGNGKYVLKNKGSVNVEYINGEMKLIENTVH